ncbi:MAG: DNA alkylation repair protein [Sulfitobacter sp.]|jgi:3-methyladenine DNA glycosylase AlkD|uniref:DNA alkylation repair protein n=1 Tax=Sulfitobacter sp. TaxID=1903071 RepID=UPI000C0FA28D|nr:MAG: DNA alkylation repair protein [Sulfitobacter sp.]|tara:strand:+ start:5861 stop:6565 length:705 start_codon:yes stop_codon:yes gene_type:complete
MNTSRYLEALTALSDESSIPKMQAYHKIDRPYLGVSNPHINDLTKAWRDELDLADRITLAATLWDTDIFEARVAAAKLLTQARMRPDDAAAWELLQSWVPDFDSWAIADHACSAIQKRLLADPARLDAVELWTQSGDLWARRAALVATLPWAKQNNPKPDEIEARERILGWASGYLPVRNGIMQKAIAWWVRDLSRHDPKRAADFIAQNRSLMKSYAIKEASRYLPEVEPDAEG